MIPNLDKILDDLYFSNHYHTQQSLQLNRRGNLPVIDSLVWAVSLRKECIILESSTASISW